MVYFIDFRLHVLITYFLFCSTAMADWVESNDPLIVRPSPEHGSKEMQNPPSFRWARAPGARDYELVLIGPGDIEQIWHTKRNWFLPSSRLKPGQYTWKVRAKGAAVPWSEARSFLLAPEAALFEVPSEEQLLQFIRARSRPRSFFSYARLSNEAIAGNFEIQRVSAIRTLGEQVKQYASKPVLDEDSIIFVPKSHNEQAWAASLATIRSRTVSESYWVRAAALLWHITKNDFYLKEAKRRGNALVALDPRGSTSHVNQDQGNRAIAWGLAVAYDYLSENLSAEENSAWLSTIRDRTEAMYSDLKSGDWRMEQTPLDSHGATNLGYVAAISALMIDSLSDAEEWFRDSFRFYIHYQSPWGSDEGGYANGTAYAQYSVDYFIDFWDVIHNTTGVNLYEKPWAKGLLRFLACFLPPGSPTHVFGDAAETKPWVTPLKAYANRYKDSFARWYADSLPGEEGALSRLNNSIENSGIKLPRLAPSENSCLFNFIGWVAMHSSWVDPNRTSIYFKSSPYAAFNHSHADNNSFVLITEGQSLLIDSGYYDWYGSPHWRNWYRQTKAHNSITFDNGRGQAEKSGSGKMMATGHLTKFDSDETMDFVEGNALAAYEGELSQARRRLWYLRNRNVLVIHDSLRSKLPRKFEWNIHALNRFLVKAPLSIEVEHNRSTACIDMVYPEKVDFVQHDQFDPPPMSVLNAKPQWHGVFQARERKTDIEFLTVVRVGCNDVSIEVNDFSLNRQIVVGEKVITISE